MYPEVFDLSANPSFVLSSASAQLTLIPLCTLFPLNISRFHAHTRRHNRTLLFIPSLLDIKAEIQVTEELLPVLLWEQSNSIQANLMKN